MTNGYNTKLILQKIKNIINLLPYNVTLILNFSLDGNEKIHNFIRGNNSAFQNLMNTLNELTAKNNAKNVVVGVNTTISKFNIQKIQAITDIVTTLNVDSYIAELAQDRKEFKLEKPMDIILKKDEAVKAIRHLKKFLKNRKQKGTAKFLQSARLEYYDIVIKTLLYNKPVLTCFAGYASAYVNYNGEVWVCSVKGGNMGNLRNNEYNFQKIWHSAKAQKIRKTINTKNCFCTMTNTFYSNMLLNIPTLIHIATRLLTTEMQIS